MLSWHRSLPKRVRGLFRGLLPPDSDSKAEPPNTGSAKRHSHHKFPPSVLVNDDSKHKETHQRKENCDAASTRKNSQQTTKHMDQTREPTQHRVKSKYMQDYSNPIGLSTKDINAQFEADSAHHATNVPPTEVCSSDAHSQNQLSMSRTDESPNYINSSPYLTDKKSTKSSNIIKLSPSQDDMKNIGAAGCNDVNLNQSESIEPINRGPLHVRRKTAASGSIEGRPEAAKRTPNVLSIYKEVLKDKTSSLVSGSQKHSAKSRNVSATSSEIIEPINWRRLHVQRKTTAGEAMEERHKAVKIRPNTLSIYKDKTSSLVSGSQKHSAKGWSVSANSRFSPQRSECEGDSIWTPDRSSLISIPGRTRIPFQSGGPRPKLRSRSYIDLKDQAMKQMPDYNRYRDGANIVYEDESDEQGARPWQHSPISQSYHSVYQQRPTVMRNNPHGSKRSPEQVNSYLPQRSSDCGHDNFMAGKRHSVGALIDMFESCKDLATSPKTDYQGQGQDRTAISDGQQEEKITNTSIGSDEDNNSETHMGVTQLSRSKEELSLRRKENQEKRVEQRLRSMQSSIEKLSQNVSHLSHMQVNAANRSKDQDDTLSSLNESFKDLVVVLRTPRH